MSRKSQVNELIALTDAPPIPGLSFRRFRGKEDYPTMLRLIEGTKEVDQIERTQSLEDIERNYDHLHNSDPYQDVLFAEVNGEAIAYSRVFWEELEEGDFIYTHFGFLLPAWRRKRIGTAMLKHNEQRLSQIANDHPLDSPKYFQSWTADTEIGTEALLKSMGYEAVRYGFEMVRDLNDPIPESPIPEGLEVRPVLEEQVWDIFDAMNEAFKDHWGHREGTREEFEGWLKDPHSNRDRWKIAWDGDEVAGMVLNYINTDENEEYNRLRGWTDPICVRRPWRKQGLATALLLQSLAYLKEVGMQEAALGVDTQNESGALNLYKKCGFKVVKRTSTHRKPMV